MLTFGQILRGPSFIAFATAQCCPDSQAVFHSNFSAQRVSQRDAYVHSLLASQPKSNYKAFTSALNAAKHLPVHGTI